MNSQKSVILTDSTKVVNQNQELEVSKGHREVILTVGDKLLSEKVNCLSRGGSDTKKDPLVQNVISKAGGSPTKSINKRLQSALKLAENIISDATVQRLVVEASKIKANFDNPVILTESLNHPTDGIGPKLDQGTKVTSHADGSHEAVLFSNSLNSPRGINRFKQADLKQVSKSQLFRSKVTEKQMSVDNDSVESLPSKKITKPKSISKASEALSAASNSKTLKGKKASQKKVAPSLETIPGSTKFSKNKPRVTLQPTPKERNSDRVKLKGSPPLTIKSEYQDKKVFVTIKDFNKWMTGEYPLSERNSNNYIHKLAISEFRENLIIQTVQKPDEVLKAMDIHSKQSECNLYITNQKTKSGKEKKFLVLTDPKSGKAKLVTRFSEAEYAYVKQTGKLNLFDLRRNPQTRVMDQKSIDEVKALKKAQNLKMLENLAVRRPYNTSESNFDFLGESSDGTITEIEITGTSSKRELPFKSKVAEITSHVRNDIAKAKGQSITICDLSGFSENLREKAYRLIKHNLTKSELEHTVVLLE